MVSRDNTVLNDTMFTDVEVSPPNFAANIVERAAVGALQEITDETSISPLTPQRYITPSAAEGKTTNLIPIAHKHLKFFRTLKILLLAKWKPIIIIGTGVLRPAI